MFNKVANTKIRKVNIDPNQRVLFISDIHGDLTLFKRALQKVDYKESDYLFLLGDVIEKGNENLAILDYLREFKQNNDRLFVLSGNCDEVFRFILPPVDTKMFLYYALEKKHSIINEMAKRLNIKISVDSNVDELCTIFAEEFKDYYKFLDSFDDVIIVNDKLVLVHAGIMDIDNIPKNALDVLKLDDFYTKSPKQTKTMIVGHYPTTNYCKGISSLNPIIDFEKNIICIDGGNNVCKYGQLNVLMLDCINNMNFDFRSVDHFPKIRILKDIDYESNEEPFSLIHGDNEVEILDIVGDFALCLHISTNKKVWVYERWITKSMGKLYAYDATNVFVKFKADTVVTLILYAQPFCIVKKEGTLALVRTRDLVMQDADI